MVYTIGYSGLTPADVERLMKRLHVDLLVDVRARPQSRKPGFSRRALESLLAPKKIGGHSKYLWAGDTLGGGGSVKREGLELIRKLHAEDKTIMLMCLENQPSQCHRHNEIALKLWPDIDVQHVFNDSIVFAGELEAGLKADTNVSLYELPR